MSEKKNLPDIIKIFGVESLITPKTLVTENEREVRRKYPNEAADDIRKLLDEINLRVVSKDIIGVCQCLEAIKLRLRYLEDVANEIRKAQGK